MQLSIIDFGQLLLLLVEFDSGCWVLIALRTEADRAEKVAKKSQSGAKKEPNTHSLNFVQLSSRHVEANLSNPN